MGFFSKYLYYSSSLIKLISGFNNPASIIAAFINDSPGYVQLRNTSVSFRVRGKIDIWAIKETFVDGFYSRHGIRVQPGWTVIDIGAGIGDFTIKAASIEDTKVFAFEPFLESFDLLRKNLTLNRISNAEIFNLAVWSEAGKLSLYASGSDPLQTRSGRDMSGKNIVESISLEQALNLTGQGLCDLIKLDCEAAEYPILMQASKEVLDRVMRIVLEYHDFPGSPGHQVLAQFLRENGYKVCHTGNYVHGNIGYMYAEKSLE